MGGSATGIDISAFDTIFCPPTMSMPSEGASGGMAASNNADLKWTGGGFPHCQLDVCSFKISQCRCCGVQFTKYMFKYNA